MKQFVFIISIFLLSDVGATFASAQEVSATERSPIAEIKKTFESPPDILDSTLKKVNQLQGSGTPQEQALAGSETAEDTDTFKNPFIPQTPQAPKAVVMEDPSLTQPVVELSKPALPIPQFTVSGLVWNTKKPAAILNGQIVAVGDEVSNWSVAAITKEGVHVKFEDQDLWIKPIVDPNNSVPPNPRGY